MRQKKQQQTKSAPSQPLSSDQALPFMEHVRELKRRLIYVAVSIFVFGGAAYAVQQHIIDFLLKPSEGQKLIYTSPGGGLNFLFKVCIDIGVVCSMPVIIYQVLKYLEPLLGAEHVRFALKGSVISAFLAVAGMAFGYYVGMPTTLHFLFHQFTSSQIHPLITIQSYMSFVTMYMFGAALLFQLALLMICVNRIKPLNPRSLFKYERWVIVVAFIISLIMNPTPNVIDQLMLAGPIILMYQIGILIIALVNRTSQPARKFRDLVAADAALQAERESRLASAKLMWQQAGLVADHPSEVREIVEATTPDDPASDHEVAAADDESARLDAAVAADETEIAPVLMPAEAASTETSALTEDTITLAPLTNLPSQSDAPASGADESVVPVAVIRRAASRPSQYIDGFRTVRRVSF